MPRYALETVILVVLILWLLGWQFFPAVGSLIHLLLIIVLAVIVIRVVQGKPPLA
jgi:hypothetical protein